MRHASTSKLSCYLFVIVIGMACTARGCTEHAFSLVVQAPVNRMRMGKNYDYTAQMIPLYAIL